MYTGKTVLITGSSRGVGRMLAEHFLFHNAKVIGISRKMGHYGINYSHIPHDISEPKGFDWVFEQIKKQSTDGLDILINNAAVLTSQYAMRMKTNDAIDMVNTDLLAPFLITKRASKLMIHGGRVVNISSMSVPLEPMGDSVYAACKAGLEKMGNIMAKELAGFKVTVNTLGISAIETDMLKQLNKEKVDKVVANLPIPRYAKIEDITNVIDFFCSSKSNYITAQTIYLGGVHS